MVEEMTEEKTNFYKVKRDLEEYTIVLERMSKIQANMFNAEISPAIKNIHNHIIKLSEMLSNIPENEYLERSISRNEDVSSLEPLKSW